MLIIIIIGDKWEPQLWSLVQGATALITAVQKGHLQAAVLLLGAGADVNAKSNQVKLMEMLKRCHYGT